MNKNISTKTVLKKILETQKLLGVKHQVGYIFVRKNVENEELWSANILTMEWNPHTQI